MGLAQNDACISEFELISKEGVKYVRFYRYAWKQRVQDNWNKL